jgi:hypothetical protein
MKHKNKDVMLSMAVLKHGDWWGMMAWVFLSRKELRMILRIIFVIACLILLDPATTGKLREFIIRELLGHLI